MNDEEVLDQNTSTIISAVQDPLSAGSMLRQAREGAGLHVAALAVTMKIPVKKLEALEADRLDLLLDVAFARALASSVCRTLKIDSVPILAKLPQNIVPKLKSDEMGINTTFHAAGQLNSFGFARFLAKPVVLTAVALVVGAAVLVFIPNSRETDGSVSAVSSLPRPVDSSVFAPAKSISAEYPVDSSVVVYQSSAGIAPRPDAISTEKPTEAVVAESAELGRPTDPASIKKVVGATQGIVAFTARGPSWIEVVDANSDIQIRRTLSTAERVVISGIAPLSVVIGKVDVVDVEVGGKPFSMVGLAKDNVARFEVK
jgi:cytoskeleton protein RodZ